jgi:CHASE2 domain-containing sensor protein
MNHFFKKNFKILIACVLISFVLFIYCFSALSLLFVLFSVGFLLSVFLSSSYVLIELYNHISK